MAKLEVTVEPHLVECSIIMRVSTHKENLELSKPVLLASLSLEDFKKAIELLAEYKNK